MSTHRVGTLCSKLCYLLYLFVGESIRQEGYHTQHNGHCKVICSLVYKQMSSRAGRKDVDTQGGYRRVCLMYIPYSSNSVQ